MQTEPSGVLIVNKHAGVTSHDIVNKIRRLFGTRRVGHTGTLDPMARGVLVVLVGRAAKASEYLVSDSKRYTAKIKLGITTDTEDITGTVLTTSEKKVSAEEFFAAADSFVGEYMQVPPMYSALKVGGKKLCDLARQGVEIEREPRKVEIFSISASPTESEDEFLLDVSCSSGTYIRTLCADIGKKLGCGAVMSSLERTETGGFSIENAHTLDSLEAIAPDALPSLLIPTESLFSSLPRVQLPEFFEKLCRGGCEIYQKKIGTSHPTGGKVALYGKDGFFALGEVREYDGGSAIKAIKTFF